MFNTIKDFYLGTSGLVLPVPNKLHYPKEFQDKSRLCYYASLLNTIEINSSFYKPPMSSTVKKWAFDVPEDFKFTFKLSKEITHSKNLAFDPELLRHFFDTISEVGSKKGCLLVQLPPSVRVQHFPQLDFLMQKLRENDPEMQWNIAIEFRHSSLYVDEIYELLNTYKLGMVIHDKRFSNTPIRDNELTFVYLRFHGPNGNYRDSYADDVLSEYASYIAEWLKDGKNVFAYFNNTMGEPHENLNTLRRYVENQF
ncbi:MAG: DUF72 domain-containing protein [Pelobium sp.]